MKITAPTDRTALTLHLAGAAGCALLLSAGWWLGLGPLLSESREGGSVVEQAVQAEQAAQRSKVELEVLTGELERINQQLERQPITLEPATRVNPLMAQLADWSDEYGLTVTQTQADRPAALAYYDVMPITLAGEGSFADLLGMMHRIHTQRGDLGLTSFNLKRLPADGRVGFTLGLAWYVLGEPGVEPPTSTASAGSN